MTMNILRLCVVALLVPTISLAQGGHRDNGGRCVGDRDHNSEVTVDEIVSSVDNALAGCGAEPVVLNFQAQVGDESFACGQSYSGIGTSVTEITPADFRLYIHNVHLITSDERLIPVVLDQDETWQYQNVALLDFENNEGPCQLGTPDTNTMVTGVAEAAAYTGLRFTLGIPFSLNHANQAVAPPPLNLSSMFWSWQNGYKFIRFDEATDIVRLHLGSTECGFEPGSGCGRPNRAEIILRGFDPTQTTIIVDLARMFTDSDIESNVPETPPGCMSGPGDTDCVPVFQNLGINFENGLPDASRQKLFRVE